MKISSKLNIFCMNCILYTVLEKKKPKRNAFYIHGPPSSGKNYFLDCICSFYLNVGNMANFNRSVQFPFCDCENRRVIMWNEINFSPGNTDSVKMLLGGDLMHVNVKFKNYQPIFRTTVIVLSNDNELHDRAFRDRVYTYVWRRASFLLDNDKKPHPLVWPHLLKHYNIINF